MSNKPLNADEVILTAVRLSYPQLFVAKSINGGDPTFGATFLLDKAQDAEQITAVRRAMTAAGKAKWGDKIPTAQLQGRLALKDGSTKPDTDGYGPEMMFVGANAKKAPVCVDLNPNIVLNRETGAKLYAGCYVNAKVRFWAQDNPQHPEWGKRINGQLLAVQFVLDGEPFGEAPVKADEVFEDMSGGADAGDPFNQAGQEDTSGLLG